MAANAAPEISKVTSEMLEAKDLDDPSTGLYDNDDELDSNELVIDNVDWTQTAKSYAVAIFMAQWTRIFTLR